MKNVSSLKSNKIDSPKTPGGISKSLLTPCRRVGLSRNWKKGGSSPFVSPLPGTGEQQDVQVKRKIEDVDLEKTNTDSCDVHTTPTRCVDIPRRKKSKIIIKESEPLTPVPTVSDLQEITSENDTVENISTDDIYNNKSPSITPIVRVKSRNNKKNVLQSPAEIPSIQCSPIEANCEEIAKVTPVIKSKSKSKKFISPLATNTGKEPENQSDSFVKDNIDKVSKLKSRKNSIKPEKKKKSPENLTKECIVVIQKKLYKGQVLSSGKNENKEFEQKSTQDSDSDDIPLCQFNKKEIDVIGNDVEKQNIPVKEKVPNLQIQPRVLALNEDDDFMEENKVKVKKLEDKTTSTTTLKKTVKNKPKENKKPNKEPGPSQSQSSDDDDFDFNLKRTILIRKSYDKVTKPSKAKSTGSIMQKDIDELRSRIEVKKKLLLAKAMTEDTEELRELIKKWQKGCQDALSELIEMMRNKFPDKQNMEFSEMLQALKIPTNLVGYDEENDCFNTPDDASIVLAKFNDL